MGLLLHTLGEHVGSFVLNIQIFFKVIYNFKSKHLTYLAKLKRHIFQGCFGVFLPEEPVLPFLKLVISAPIYQSAKQCFTGKISDSSIVNKEHDHD